MLNKKLEKNILLVANWDSNVGFAWWLMENFWVTISNEYSKRGYKVFLIYSSISIIPEAIRESEIVVLEHDFSNHSINETINLVKMIKENNIGFLYLTDRPAIALYYGLLRLFGIKKIIVHDHTPGLRSKATGLNKVIKFFKSRIPFITADHLIAVTEFVYSRFIGTLVWPEKKCSIAKNGIIPIQEDPAFSLYANKQFGLPDAAKIVITTGRASYYKRIDFIIESAKSIIIDHGVDNIYFIHCGDGPDLNDFKTLVNKYRISDKFIFAGKRSDVPQLLQSSDIGVQASTGEVGYSLSILEYMSAGLATLVSDNASVNQAIVDGVDGYVFPENSVNKLTEIIIELASNDEKRLQTGQKAKQSVMDNFNLQTTNLQLMDSIQKVFV